MDAFSDPAQTFLTRRANQRHYRIITQLETPSPRRPPGPRSNTRPAVPDNGIFGAIAVRRADWSRRRNPPFFTGKTADYATLIRPTCWKNHCADGLEPPLPS